MNATLHRAALHYGGGLVLHTAASGSVAALDALYLRLSDGDLAGVGETRLNIAYLNGLDADAVIANARDALTAIDWRQDVRTLVDTSMDWLPAYLAPVRMMIDSALRDLFARRTGTCIAAQFGVPPATNGTPGLAWPTNQTLFWSTDAKMLERAAAYVTRGFTELKLRIGIGTFDDDLRRIDLLRARFGDTIALSADANGQWQPDDCAVRLAALAERRLDYLEQPIAAGDWDALQRIANASPLTLMLDESLKSDADVDALCALAGHPLAAHLKLVKLGGIGATIAAARRLADAGIPLMIGQMNEGAAATAAALQVCAAVSPRWAELYGADGLVDDPVTGLAYSDGSVRAAGPFGLGVTFDASATYPV
ncbi:MAG: enolase C-terminal domain-like protein [Paraburkholderia sp.]|uniref:mandelate racemase/muconate lactonizing enzyme family protein n=1 Tax=Burkholderiaceae TaxID=119060 RepID=UPI0010FA1845|nr:enolase C-terminal domain-like protein [Burkholderia sp. 4M9327F10]